MNRRNILSASMALAILTFTLLCAPPTWAQTFKVLHNFGSPGDGAFPPGGLALDPQGESLWGDGVRRPEPMPCFPLAGMWHGFRALA